MTEAEMVSETIYSDLLTCLGPTVGNMWFRKLNGTEFVVKTDYGRELLERKAGKLMAHHRLTVRVDADPAAVSAVRDGEF